MNDISSFGVVFFFKGISQFAFSMCSNVMKHRHDDIFLLFFRVMYLSIFTGYTCFTILGFGALGAPIGMVATVVVAVGSEIAFVLAKKEQEEDRMMQERYTV